MSTVAEKPAKKKAEKQSFLNREAIRAFVHALPVPREVYAQAGTSPEEQTLHFEISDRFLDIIEQDLLDEIHDEKASQCDRIKAASKTASDNSLGLEDGDLMLG